MKWITPFAFIDASGTLHLCCDRVLKEVGLPITEENLRIAEFQLLEAARKALPGVVISNVERDLAEHPELVEPPEADQAWAEAFTRQMAANKERKQRRDRLKARFKKRGK